jgi:L-lactate dehydrogenase complex protein LldE
MVKVFYQELFDGEPELLRQAQIIASRVFEFSEFLVKVLGVTDTGASCSAKVTYHDCCHLRNELGIISEPRALITGVKGVELVEMKQSDVCCGFGGTFAVKYSAISGAILKEKVKHIRESGADILVANDVSCLMHMSGSFSRLGADVKPMHIAQLLDQAQGE